MSLLIPLGLLGLLGVVGLIIIYIIKPNFQQKIISSTYVWKLSLKYRKKRLSTNKLRNIILIICQILILVSCAVILAQPVSVIKAQEDKSERIIVIDSSSSMRASVDGETRFERAVDKAVALANETFDSLGIVSVIIADDVPNYLVRRANSDARTSAVNSLIELKGNFAESIDISCSYGSADVDAAMTLASEVVEENPGAAVIFITDKTYDALPDGVTLVSVRSDFEWNAGILNATAELYEGFYKVTVELACYGRDSALDLKVTVNNANIDSVVTESKGIELTENGLRCPDGVTQTVVFKYELTTDEVSDGNVVYHEIGANKFYSFGSICVTLTDSTGSLSDSYSLDDVFWIYGGTKERIKVQYASSLPNPFFQVMLNVIRDNFANDFDVALTFVKPNESPELSGFDYYIFEHRMPDELPTDGAVFLVDPETAPKNAGFKVNGVVKYSDVNTPLSSVADDDPLMANLIPNDLTVSSIENIVLSSSSDYKVLMRSSVDDKPVLFYKNEPGKLGFVNQIIVLGFSVHYSNIVMKNDFPLLMMHAFEMFFPVTVSKNAFNVYESVEINSRTGEAVVSGPSMEKPLTIKEFPYKIKFEIPGAYSVKEETYTGKIISQELFVRTPAEESNLFAVGENFTDPYKNKDKIEFYKDLLFYIALALAALLFIEWWLQSRDNM